MKTFILLTSMSFPSLITNGQSFQDKEAVKNVIIAFQEDFNEGSFKNAAAFSTIDWEHINPGVVLTRDVTAF